MSKRGMFFYDSAASPFGRRPLPDTEAEGIAATVVAASGELLYESEEPRTPEQLAEEIMEELCSPHARLLSRQSPVPLSTVFGLLCEFLEPYATVTALPMEGGASSPVAVCAHNLYYVIGMLVHYTVKYDIPLIVRAEDGEESLILLELDRPAASPEEVAAHFALDKKGRLSLFERIAEASGFSVALRDGAHAAIAFRLVRRSGDLLRLNAVSDPSLYTAFTQAGLN